MLIYTYCDGSVIGNPGVGGWAYAYEVGAKRVTCSGGVDYTTNNAMELKAAIKALSGIIKRGLHLRHEVVVVSDSRYVINGASKWMEGWQRRGWKLATGEQVANADLWKELAVILKMVDVKWRWVKGHRNSVGNIAVDAMALKAARHQKSKLAASELVPA